MSYSAFHLGGDERRTIKETFTQLRGWDPARGAYGVEAFVNNHMLRPGDVVRHDGGPADPPGYGNETVGWVKALANNPENAEALGVVESVEGDTFVVVLQGRFRLDLMSDTLEHPKVYYLDREIPGKLVCHQPQGAGEVIKPMLLTTDVKSGYVVNYIGTVIGGDCTVDVTEISPVGQILPFAGPTGQIPDGHLLCDGSKFITGGKWQDLFNVIGHTYGMSGGSDADWFHIPDLQGRFPLGANIAGSGTGLTTRNLGATGGSEISTLAAGDDFDGSDSSGQDRELTGDNMPPFTAINFIIRYQKDANAVVHCPSSSNPFTNQIINGGFDYWQRGTNFNVTGGITGNQSFYTADRWVNQVYWDDNTTTEWKGGINLGRFPDGQTAVPYYPKYYAKIQSYLTGHEEGNYSAAFNMNDPQGIDGQTIGIKDETRYGRDVTVVGGSIRTGEGRNFPTSWKSVSGKKPASLSWQNKYESDDAYCVGEHHSSDLRNDWIAVAGPFDWSKKDPDYPANGQEFTIEGWFKVSGGLTHLTGAVSGYAGQDVGPFGGHAPITLLRFGTPPTDNQTYGTYYGGVTGDHAYHWNTCAPYITGTSGPCSVANSLERTAITGINGHWNTNLQIIATDDWRLYTPTGHYGGATPTGNLYPVVQFNREGATGNNLSWEHPLSVTGKTNINDGEWHHICFARNNECNEYKLFVDGILEATGNASGNDIAGPVWGLTGGTGGVGDGIWNTGNDYYRHGDMYIFGALDLENVCTTGDYCADGIKITEGADRTILGLVTGYCTSEGLTGHQGFTGDIPGYPYRNFSYGDDDEGGAGSEHKGFCAFSQRIEGVRTFAEGQDEYVTLSFWARGIPGPQTNGDIHINLKQCFGSDISPITGYGEEQYGNTARSSSSKYSVSKYHSSTSKFSSSKSFGNMGNNPKSPNLEFDSTLVESSNINSIGVKGNIQDCEYCTDTCFDCGSEIPAECQGCKCCSRCQSYSGNCSQCPPGVDCGVDVCPKGYCCYSQGACEITTCEDCKGSWTLCTDPEGKCFGQTSCPEGQCDWYKITESAKFSATSKDTTPFRFDGTTRSGVEANTDGKESIGIGTNPDDRDDGGTGEEIVVGACCGLCGVSAIESGCVDNIDRTLCESYGGTFQGANTFCPGCASTAGRCGECCVSYGLCCTGWDAVPAFATGDCSSDYIHGTSYVGLGCASGTATVCEGTYMHLKWNEIPNNDDYLPGGFVGLCATGSTGACCQTNGTCLDGEDINQCYTSGGAWNGWATRCADSDIDCTTGGACCHWDGTCFGMYTTGQCYAVSGIHHGNGVLCSAVTCTGHGACCNEADGKCYEVVSGDCGTTYLTGEHCYDVVCDQRGDIITGNCCVDGIGSVTSEIECDNLGGRWTSGGAPDKTACCRVLPGVRISLHPVWKKYEITFRVPHLSGIKVGDRLNDYFEVNFFTYADIEAGIENKLVGYGSSTLPQHLPCNYPHEWNLAQVQMERGQKASRWEYRPDQIEKQLCERYYEVRRDFSFTTFKHLTGDENHGDISAPPTGGTFHSREFIPYEVEKLYERPEVFVFGVEESTYRLTGFSVVDRNADGFVFKSNYNTGSDAGLAHLTGNYAVISEIYTPEEEARLGYDFYQNDEGA